MEILILVIIVAVVIGYFSKSKEKIKVQNYKKVFSVLNNSEKAFYLELKNKLPINFHIFPKMRIIDFIQTDFKSRNRIWAKHVDFLIVDNNFKPIMGIEINGGSHLSEKRQSRDVFVKEVFKSAQLPLEIINVGSNFSQAVEKIMPALTTL